jgi:hypothetical protein
MVLRTARPLKAGPSAAQVEVERAMWSPNPDPLRGFVEDHFWNLGSRFLRDFVSLVLGKKVQIAKAEGMPKPPGWGEVMKLFETGGGPAHQMATWNSLIDGFVQALLPAHTAEDAARVWALRSAMLGTIEDRIKAITTPGAWDGYFHTMPPAQQHIANWTQLRGANFITKLTSSARQKALDVLVEGQLQGAGPRWVQTQLMERMGELNRDWRRIAITETAMAIENGKLAAVADDPGQWEAVWVGGPHACPFCRSMFGRTFTIVAKPKPGMDPEKFIWPGKHNVGRSMHLHRRDGTKRGPEELWIPCIPAHPHCMCLWSIRRKLTNAAGKKAEEFLAGIRKKRYAVG